MLWLEQLHASKQLEKKVKVKESDFETLKTSLMQIDSPVERKEFLKKNYYGVYFAGLNAMVVRGATSKQDELNLCGYREQHKLDTYSNRGITWSQYKKFCKDNRDNATEYTHYITGYLEP